MSTSFSCTLVIPTRYRAKDLEACLAAVTGLSPRPGEIIVVDNTDGDEATLRAAQAAGARYVREPVPGAARARNAGWREARGEVVAFLDDDVLPHEGWLAALLEPFADAAVVATTGRVVGPGSVDGNGAGAGRKEPRQFDLGSEGRVFDRSCEWWFEMANFGGVGYGAIMAIRRSVMGRWPGFHPMIGRGTAVPAGEDNYAFFELLKLGGRIVYCPNAIVSNAEPAARAALRVDPVARVSDASAYVALLLAEEPGWRLRTLRFAAAGLMGRTRPWRKGVSVEAPPTWSERVRGLALGPSLYLRARLASRRDPSRPWRRGVGVDSGPLASQRAE